MYSKLVRFAMTLAAVLCTGCSVHLPWSAEPVGQKTNLAFVMRNNLLYIPSATIDGRPGTFIFGSSQPVSVIDTRFARASWHTLQLSEKQSLRFTSVNADLHGIADAIIGANVWGSAAVTVDYRVGLITLQREGIHPEMMTLFRYADEPMITIHVDGQTLNAIVDTTSPDTVVLAGNANGRRTAQVQIAGTDFGNIDIRSGGAAVSRVGNRLLSKFLISIDYGRHVVGLWRDPRIAL